MAKTLAIIIPAFKSNFLYQTMQSISEQTCKDFSLYIGDDASADNIEEIVNQFKNKIDLVYHRFDTNIGGKNLTKQWERCISLSQGEEYIWLFSDDDLLPPDAVERFYDFLGNYPNYDLYRFNIQLIDQNNVVMVEASDHKVVESIEEFIENRLLGTTHSAAIEYIFTKEIFREINGFVSFPLAWGSDDATWIKMGYKNGIVTIPGAPVMWRISGLNITSLRHNRNMKFRAILLFYKWLKSNPTYKNVSHALVSYGVLRQANILKISLISYITNIFKILELIGSLNTFKLGYITLKLNVKKCLGFLK